MIAKYFCEWNQNKNQMSNYLRINSTGHFKKGHSDKGHKEEKKGEEEEKKTVNRNV